MTNQCQHGALARVCAMCEAAEELTRLRAEVEALKADAERYRWLRDGASAHLVDLLWHTYAPEERDTEIDAARAALAKGPTL